MDCRNISEATKMATELYTQASHVPFMAKFVVFAKRVDQNEARIRVFCMTDDREDKTLEQQEHFTEVAKSRDVEVLEGRTVYMEFAGNLIPVMKSGDQLQLGFKAFKENRLAYTMRVKDYDEGAIGRVLFMSEPKVAKGEPAQVPLCTLNIVLPEKVILEAEHSELDLLALEKNYSFLRDGGISRPDVIHRADIRLADISNLLDTDWEPLALELGVTQSDINLIKEEYANNISQQAMVMIRLWLRQSAHKATGNALEKSLHKIGRSDIVKQCICNMELVTDDVEKAVAKVRLDQSGFDTLKEELGPSRDTSLRRNTTMDASMFDDSENLKSGDSLEDLDKSQTDSEPNVSSKEEMHNLINGQKKYSEEEKEMKNTIEEFLVTKKPNPNCKVRNVLITIRKFTKKHILMRCIILKHL